MGMGKHCYNCAYFERTIARYGVRECQNPKQPPHWSNDHGDSYMSAWIARDQRGFCGPDRKAWEPRKSGPFMQIIDAALFGLVNANE